jgi:hypothetical protein
MAGRNTHDLHCFSSCNQRKITGVPASMSGGKRMSQVYNPESELVAEIERREFEARNIRRRVEHAHTEADKRVLNRQLQELKDQIEYLRYRLR